jgi:hypothetical protein
MIFWGLGLVFGGAGMLRWGVHAISRRPAAGSDYRIFLGVALVAVGALVLACVIVSWLAFG